MMKHINDLQETKNVYKKESDIQGEGIFAKKDFKRGDRIIVMKGVVVKRHYMGPADDKDFELWVELKKDVWMDPFFPIVKTNHSCSPTMGVIGEKTFVALRDIKKGEELTFDYSVVEEELAWKMPCHCGSQNCRKTITSIQLLPKNIYENYLPFIPKYFQNIYNKYQKF